MIFRKKKVLTNITPFQVYIIIDRSYVNVEIRPCCEKNKIVDYAIWIKGKLEFTVKKNNGKWVIAMQNADDQIDDITLQQIGMEIDKKNKRR